MERGGLSKSPFQKINSFPLILYTHVTDQTFFVLGNKSKCRGLLRKGKDIGAQPKELLIKAYDSFVAGRKVLIDDCEELTGFTYRVQQKSSESSVDLSPLSTGKGAFFT